MKLFPEPEETIEGVGRALRSGKRTCVDVLESCLAKIDEWEPQVHAWVVVDRDGAMAQARRLDEELTSGRCRGPLHGIPIGIKDIIDVAGLPTAAGFLPWRDRIAEEDATIVASLRAAGAVILGKTVTTQFAWIDPPVTCNPWNLDRTPGGSSSGSAAAVACGMCLGAIGTQTGGSIIRPASFCGVAGYKPHRWFAMNELGIVEFAPSLDHWGPIARSVRDLFLIFMGCLWWKFNLHPDELSNGFETFSSERVNEMMDFYFGDSDKMYGPPKLAILNGFFERSSDPIMWRAFQRATNALGEAGAEILTLDDPLDFEEILRRHRTIMAAEAAAGHESRYREANEHYRPRIRELLNEGFAISATDYLQSHAHQREQVRKIRGCLDEFGGCFLMPATIGPAPSTETTGDPAFSSPWTYTGICELSFPMAVTADGLPLALQIVGMETNEKTFKTARWCEEVIRRQSHSSQERL